MVRLACVFNLMYSNFLPALGLRDRSSSRFGIAGHLTAQNCRLASENQTYWTELMVLAVDLGVSRLATEIDWLRWQNLATRESCEMRHFEFGCFF